jgi:ABC-type nitrate/sulfonate/bicarbonate transport system substrate-binding protein
MSRARVLAAFSAVLALAVLSAHSVSAAPQAGAGSAAATAADATPKKKYRGPCVANPKPKKRTRITSLLVPYFGLEHIASARGFFQKHNLTVAFIPTVQGAGALPAIVSGQAQTLQSSTALTYLLAIQAGVNVTAVASGYASAGKFDVVRFVVRQDSGIDTARDLVGKTVGMPATVSYYSMALDGWLLRNGVDPSAVKRVAVPPLNQGDALLKRQVDVVGIGDVYYTQLQAGPNRGEVKTLFRDRDGIPAAEKSVTAFIFRNDYMQKHPGVICAWVAAVKDAAKFVKSDPIGAKQIISTVTGIPPQYVPIPVYPKNLCLDLKAMNDYPPLMEKIGLLKPGVVKSASQWVTNRYNPDC